MSDPIDQAYYRGKDCPNCGRNRVMLGGVCEKCRWDVDGGDYASITGKCAISTDGKHYIVPGNNIMGPPFNECEFCHLEESQLKPGHIKRDAQAQEEKP